MIDLVGIDVLARDSDQRTLRGDFYARGRFGQKTKGGFYDYDDDRRAAPSPIAAEIIAAFARFKAIAPTGPRQAEDIDVAAVLGYNWPAYTGGPMFWADGVGLPRIVDTLRAMERRTGESAFRPAKLLADLAEQDRRFSEN
jgi:3-hydroxyacyl-CoA dehydrogenase